jgi:hypothetical protein
MDAITTSRLVSVVAAAVVVEAMATATMAEAATAAALDVSVKSTPTRLLRH